MSRLHARRRLCALGLSIAIAAPISTLATTAAVATDSTSDGTTFVVLKRGTDGPRVKLTQRALEVNVTGHFNLETKHAVKHFQDRRGFEVTGIVNRRTMKALRNRWEQIQQARARLDAKYQRIMKVARNQKGDPYRYGAAGPNAFDCSGYTMFVYAKATNRSLVHRADVQFKEGDRITRRQARPGDLVFMYDSGGIYHAAIYAGHGDILHASTPGTNVKRDPIWTHKVLFARMLPRA